MISVALLLIVRTFCSDPLRKLNEFHIQKAGPHMKEARQSNCVFVRAQKPSAKAAGLICASETKLRSIPKYHIELVRIFMIGGPWETDCWAEIMNPKFLIIAPPPKWFCTLIPQRREKPISTPGLVLHRNSRRQN